MSKINSNTIPYCEDATNSWSGYNYQGKIAIYLTLLKINMLVRDSSLDEIKNYCLELEWVEDFSIVYRNGNYRNYSSIHQVKARADKNINKYDDAIFKLYHKIKNLKFAESAFLHVSVDDLILNEKTWEETVKNIVEEGKSAKEELDLINKYYALSKDDKIKEIAKIIKPGANNKANRLIINYNNNNFKYKKIDINNVDSILMKIIEDIKIKIADNMSSISEESLEKIKLYAYASGRNYCAIDEIDNMIREEIKTYLSISNAPSWKKKDDKLIDMISKTLWANIDQHIINRHKNYGFADNKDIEFSSFIEVLNSDQSVLRCEEYYLSLLKEEIIHLCEVYHSECLGEWDSDEERKKMCDICEISRFKHDIMNKNLLEIKDFLLVVNPDLSREFDDRGHSHYCNDLKIKNTLFYGIRNISRPYESNVVGIAFIGEDYKSNLLTTVQNDSSNKALAKTCRNIILNKNTVEILMDYDVIISKDFNVPSVYEGAGDMLSSFKIEENHIYHYKKVQMKSLASIISEFER